MERLAQLRGSPAAVLKPASRRSPGGDLARGSIQPRQEAASGPPGLAGVVAPGVGPDLRRSSLPHPSIRRRASQVDRCEGPQTSRAATIPGHSRIPRRRLLDTVLQLDRERPGAPSPQDTAREPAEPGPVLVQNGKPAKPR